MFSSLKDKILNNLPIILDEAKAHGIGLSVHVLQDEAYCRPVFSQIYNVITLVPVLNLLRFAVSEAAFVGYLLELRPEIIAYLQENPTTEIVQNSNPSE